MGSHGGVTRRAHAYPATFAGELGVRVVAGGGSSDLTREHAHELLTELAKILGYHLIPSTAPDGAAVWIVRED